MARLAGAAAVVVTASVLAWTVGADAPGAAARGGRFDARDLVAEQVLPRTALSPLAAFADLRAARSELLFTVRADRPVDRLRVATLTRFDGHLWSATGPHLRAGRTLPPGAAHAGEVVRTRLDVRVADLERATWLPTLGASGRAAEISVPGLGVDSATGDLVVPSDRTVPRGYRVVSHEPKVSVETLRSGVAATPAPGGDTLPQASALDRTYLPAIRTLVDRAPTSFGRVAALSTYFSRNGGFSRDDSQGAASGHGLSQIERLLRTRRGTSEQYASAFAVLARRLGYDARVAVGFELDSAVPAGEAADITGAAAHAWPEVRFRQLGWVPFEPTPTVVRPRRRPGTAVPSASDRVEEAVDQEAKGQPRRDSGDDDRSTGGPTPVRRSPVRAADLLPVVAGAFAGIAALGAAIPPLAKVVRRRRRRRVAEPWRRVTGAWDDAVERLVEHRVPVDPGMTSGELTAAATARLGPDRTRGLTRLAALADTASFAADDVRAGQDVAAWELSDQLRRTLATGVAPHHRVRVAVDPRPLGRRPSRSASDRRAGTQPLVSAGRGKAR